MSGSPPDLASLHRRRPRSRFVRASLLLIGAIVAYASIRTLLAAEGLFAERRARNLARFLSEAWPHGEGGRALRPGEALAWAGEYVAERGGEATATTLSISVVAIVLAGLFAAFLALAAARTFASAEPFSTDPRTSRGLAALCWRALALTVRGLFVLLRAVPEYVWAFLMLAGLGPTAWAAVLALALHNLGVLGRLYAESVENLPPGPPAALRSAGASRLNVTFGAVFPAVLPRFLLYLFYRWETCVRAATVLGMLGIVSLGYWIEDARARTHYDVLLLLVLLGAGLVLAGDLLSAIARSLVRRAK